MRNRAKCKLCNDIIESLHASDFVKCKCGEIAIDGGKNVYKAYASNWENFIRIDDKENEIPVKLADKASSTDTESQVPLTRQDKVQMLKGMIDAYEQLPPSAMTSYTTQYDLAAALLLIYEIIKDL